jgi:hypothetical protein
MVINEAKAVVNVAPKAAGVTTGVAEARARARVVLVKGPKGSAAKAARVSAVAALVATARRARRAAKADPRLSIGPSARPAR